MAEVDSNIDFERWIEDFTRWIAGRLNAYIWWCGDDYCDCTQPTLERITPNLQMGFPWIHRETLWQGTLVSGDY
jgi:hypothetical protein